MFYRAEPSCYEGMVGLPGVCAASQPLGCYHVFNGDSEYHYLLIYHLVPEFAIRASQQQHKRRSFCRKEQDTRQGTASQEDKPFGGKKPPRLVVRGAA